MLDAFLRHRREVVTRRTIFELRKARERGHVLEGLAVALANIDEIIALIKAAPTPAEAKRALMARALARRWCGDCSRAPARSRRAPRAWPPSTAWSQGGLPASDAQAQAILEMRLQRLTGLEQDKIVGEYQRSDGQDRRPAGYPGQAGARHRRSSRDELIGSATQFGDERRSEIITHTQDMSMEDLIAPQDVVVTLSHGGYMKSQPLDEYQAQKRGGRGKQATATKEDDFIDNLFIANTHDYILCFSNRGRVYWLKVYEVPQAGRSSRGKPIVNLLPLEEGEKINAVLPVKQFDEEQFVFMATSEGTVKKTPLTAFSRPRASGIIAVDLREDDHSDRRGAHRRQARRDAVLERRQGGALRRERSAADGTRGARRARHEAGARAAR